MGGIGFAIDIEPAGASPDPKGLYDAMYALVETNIKKLAKGKPYTHVVAEYVSLARDDGWGTAKEIVFNFKDSGGCNMSADATYHWFELLVAALREKAAFEPLAASYDLRLRWRKPKPLKALLARCDEPLVELRGRLFSTGKLDGDVYITSDDEDDETITVDDLSKAERAKVVAAFTKKKCACKVCAALRAKPPLVLPKPKKAEKKATSSPKRKRTKRYGNSLYIRDASLTALGPKNLRGTITGLQIDEAPITDLPAELEKHPIKWVGLGTTKITRVPDVLTRIPLLEQLSLYKNPIALADLAKLPGLRNLWIDEWADIPIHELPFEALPNLEHLRVRHGNLRTLPALGALKVLKVDGNAFESVAEAILRVPTLEELDLGFNPLVSVPRSWASLPRLRKLELQKAQITEIGDGLDAIEELGIGGTKIERLAVGKLGSLRVLYAESTPLREIDALPAKLEWLNLRYTQITAFPDVRAAKKSLQRLWLERHEALRELPEWFGELEALEELHLHTLSITSLPESMQNLRKLRTLNLQGTKVFPAPDWFAKLTALEKLDVYKDDLPHGEAARLKKLLPKAKIEIT